MKRPQVPSICSIEQRQAAPCAWTQVGVSAAIASIAITTVISSSATAQSIVPVPNTGPDATRIIQNGNQFNIQGGQTSSDGGNVLHRFDQFNLKQGEIANFQLTPAIQNVLNFVQGSDPSIINGLLQITGAEANLFLINPQGILFGQDARLNLPASLFATTATGLGWGEVGLEQWLDVYAPGPDLSQDLTVVIPAGDPSAFRFDLSQPGSVFNAGQLRLPAGERLFFLGGQVGNTGQIAVPQGEVSLGAVSGQSVVRLQPGTQKGFVIEPLTIVGSSAVQGQSVPSLPALLTLNQSVIPVSEAGGIAIDADGTVRLLGAGVESSGNSALAPVVQAGAGNAIVAGAIDASCLSNCDANLTSSNAGRVVIWGDDTTKFHGDIFARGGSLGGDGGFVEVSGKQTLVFRGNVDTTAAQGETGLLLLDPENVIIRSGSGESAADGPDTFQGQPSGIAGQIASSDVTPTTIFESELEGLAGNTNITIQATNDITIEDLEDNVLLFAPGQGTTISFQADADADGAGAFTMEDTNDILQVATAGASPILATAGRNIEISGAELIIGGINAPAGNITLQANNGDIQTGTLSTNAGNGGDITVYASGNVSIGGLLDARGGQDAGGNIAVTSTLGDLNLVDVLTNAGEITLFAGEGVIAGDVKTEADSSLVSGPISITANRGSITTDEISTAASNQAGNVTLTAAENITLQGLIDTESDTSSNGTSGTISITSGGNITAESITQEGDMKPENISSRGADITLQAAGDIRTGSLDSAGSPGAGNLTILSNGSVSTTDLNAGFGPFPGGSIDVQARNAITITGTVTSDSDVADGGDISLTSQGAIQTGAIFTRGGNSADSASNAPGRGGNVNIATTSSFLGTGDPISIQSGGEVGGGQITISHNGIAGNQEFAAGESSANGTRGEIRSGDNSTRAFQQPDSFANGSGVLGDIRIIGEGATSVAIPTVSQPEPAQSPEAPFPDQLVLAPDTPPVVQPQPQPQPDPLPEPLEPPELLPEPLPEVRPEPLPEPGENTTPTGGEPEPGREVAVSPASEFTTIESDSRNESQETEQTQQEESQSKYLLAIQEPTPEYLVQRIETRLTNEVQAYLTSLEPKAQSKQKAFDITTLTQTQQRLREVEEETGIKPGLIYAAFTPSVPQEMTQEGNASATNLAWSPQCPWLTPKPSQQQKAGRFRETLTLFLVTADDVVQRSAPQSERSQVHAVAQDFLCTVRDPAEIGSNSYLAAAQQLYQWMVAPLENALETQGVENLVFIPDRDLRTLPLAALHDGQDFIINRYSLGMMPSFSPTDTRLSRIQQQKMLAMGASEFQGSAPPLVATPVEITTLTQNLWQGRALLNTDFTLANLKRERQSNPFGILHLATHANFQPSDRDDSYIQLWNQRLKFSELRQLGWQDSPIELLTLSACRTAIGDDEAALGFAGFAVNAGVKSALASLWYVSDGGTLPLMLEFYNQLKQQPIKAEALRQTQLSMARGNTSLNDGTVSLVNQSLELPEAMAEAVGTPDLSHPYYWSAFTIVGNPW